jgi:DmsE family decaheme c-type cytochrome
MPSMRYAVRRMLAFGVLALIVALVGTILRAAQSADAQSAKPAAQPPPSTQPAGYVGEDTCLTCHDGQSYQGTAHALKSNPKTPASTHGCESCHGPGKAHVDAGGDPALIQDLAKLPPREASAVCATCHDRGTHALWDGSPHDQRNVSCVTCHSVHAGKGDKQLKAATQPELCASCHRNIVNRQHRFSHMPVREGRMQCSSCHNVHGSPNMRLLKTGTTVDESCTSCHTEKRGPYLWEHAPVADSCVTCHDPHGSNNDRMLVAKPPYLCQRCHVTSRHPPTVYDGFLLGSSTNANKMVGKGCVNCHQQIHGSNAPSGQFFLR